MRTTPGENLRNSIAAVVAILMCALLGGCPFNGGTPKPTKGSYVLPPHQVGTVGEHARLVGGRALPVHGFGVVGGLGKDGSSQIPPNLRQYLIQYLRKRDIGSRRAGMGDMPPERMLRDMDTAIVEISGYIPQSAPKGQTFDLQVRAIGSQARSLAGGVLYEAELRLATENIGAPDRGSRILATAAGTILVNPFIDENNVAELVKLREGRLVGGGKTVEPRHIRLQMLIPDFSRAALIQRRINERFQRPGRPRVANAKGSEAIEITVPPEWRKDYTHFLELLIHLPLRTGSGQWEKKARDIARAMTLPAADHNGLSLVWEAMGRRAIPIISTHYTSSDPFVSFYSARAGIRLGDVVAAPEVLMRVANSPGSPLRNEAIREFGRHPAFLRAIPLLKQLLDDSNDIVRVLAYEALRRRGSNSAVLTIPVGGGEFYLDLVGSKRQYVIYATQSGTPRIVLFGRDMVAMKPIYFGGLRGKLTINAKKDDRYLTVFRKVGETGRISPAFGVDPHIRSLARALGDLSDRGQGMLMAPELDEKGKPVRDNQGRIVYKQSEIKGLGFTYGQVVAVLYRMCKQGSIPAKFVLQKPSGLQEFLRGTTGVGRPNITRP